MPDPARRRAEQRGHWSESFAALLLRLNLYRILARRVKTHAGEIDLVALSLSGLVCIIEVKARRETRLAAEAVGDQQKARLARAASLYLASQPHLAGRGLRFDIVAVTPRGWPRHFRDVWRPD